VLARCEEPTSLEIKIRRRDLVYYIFSHYLSVPMLEM
jgi:hypothetical protein